MNPYEKFLLDFNGARPFSFKKFPLCNYFYVNYGQEFQIRAQLMTDTVYIKRDPTRLSYNFRIRLTVFMALTNCFRKNFMDFVRFVFNS